MSRHKPIALRHKHQPAPSRATTRTLGRLGLKIAAITCGLVMAGLCAAAVVNLVDAGRQGAASRYWESAAMIAAAAIAGVLGWRVWELKRWACYAAAVVGALVSILEPWRPSHYPNGVVDISAAIAAGVMGCVLFVAPLTVACIVEREELKSGF